MSTVYPTRRQLSAVQYACSPPAPTSRATVFVVNDDAADRRRMEVLLHHAGWRTDAFADVGTFLRRPPTRSTGCLVVDIGTTDLAALNFYVGLGAGGTGMPVILTRGAGDVLMLIQAGKTGSRLVPAPTYTGNDLLENVRYALDLCESDLIHESEMRQLERRYASLSRREQQVMSLVVSGLMNKQVGGELGISEVTVKAHRGRVMRKMNVRTLAELVRIAAELRSLDQRRPVHSRATGPQRPGPWHSAEPAGISGRT